MTRKSIADAREQKNPGRSRESQGESNDPVARQKKLMQS